MNVSSFENCVYIKYFNINKTFIIDKLYICVFVRHYMYTYKLYVNKITSNFYEQIKSNYNMFVDKN